MILECGAPGGAVEGADRHVVATHGGAEDAA